MSRWLMVLGLVAAASAGVYLSRGNAPAELVLTGVVTTREIVVAPQIGGRVERLLVHEGDAVQRGQPLLVLAGDELRGEREFYSLSAEGAAAEVEERESELQWHRRQAAEQVARAEALLAAAGAAQAAAAAELARARSDAERQERLLAQGITTRQAADDARSATTVAEARAQALASQVHADRAAVALARSEQDRVLGTRARVAASRKQEAAATARRSIADARLAYTRIDAPAAGLVDTRGVREGEVVAAGGAVLTLIDPDDLWVRVDIEETYLPLTAPGATFDVRLPSGERRRGTVFHRRADGGFATQRDVSRTKRDIRTFEIRLRVDNSDRALAAGMTAYVHIPLTRQ